MVRQATLWTWLQCSDIIICKTQICNTLELGTGEDMGQAHLTHLQPAHVFSTQKELYAMRDSNKGPFVRNGYKTGKKTSTVLYCSTANRLRVCLSWWYYHLQWKWELCTHRRMNNQLADCSLAMPQPAMLLKQNHARCMCSNISKTKTVNSRTHVTKSYSS